jgi:hypothetical protein
VLVHLDVDGAPPDVILGGVLEDDTLVLGRATGLLAREVDQSTVGRDDGTLVVDGILVKRSDGGVALRGLVNVETGKGVVVEAKSAGKPGQRMRTLAFPPTNLHPCVGESKPAMRGLASTTNTTSSNSP